ncbi:uncharacterized protein EI97DRAFT_454796 [Westerdykella ornata]|uniref:Uncharacterized protein n=1 Tax=Westerdykella ornata TaxID=318751 RepID=A0A6A6JUE5_WESOR|nr:uncharacterized protein EI97DRAFT_454796 [Westerdykella ornata]KAF2279844.1 hypothetical protein EI97DRAFT_454796 [Westerdykella ornata]
MAGLAQMLEGRLLGENVRHRYLAGLWSSRFAEDLSCTTVDFEPGAESMAGVPSWSWASTTAANDYIYGRPSDTYVELVDAKCKGYAMPKSPELKVKGFIVPLFMRVDPKSKDYEGRPHRTFWMNGGAALKATTEGIEAKRDKEREKGARTTHFLVLDMPVCPVKSSGKAAALPDGFVSRRVDSIARAQSSDGDNDSEESYVAQVQLLLLTKTDVAYTALVLAPIRQQPGKVEGTQGQDVVYQRLGLVEMDCIPGRSTGYMETADGLKEPVKKLWRAKNLNAAANQSAIAAETHQGHDNKIGGRQQLCQQSGLCFEDDNATAPAGDNTVFQTFSTPFSPNPRSHSSIIPPSPTFTSDCRHVE